MLNLIVAVDKDFGIGKDNDILYHFSSDLKHFKEKTSNSVIVMGRKTFESLPKKLKNRVHIVLSSKEDIDGADCVLNSTDAIIELSQRTDVWVIGGSQVYKQLLPHVHRIELTKINGTKQADTKIPFLESELKNFRITKGKAITDIDLKTNVQFRLSFTTLVRKRN